MKQFTSDLSRRIAAMSTLALALGTGCSASSPTAAPSSGSDGGADSGSLPAKDSGLGGGGSDSGTGKDSSTGNDGSPPPVVDAGQFSASIRCS